MPTTTNPATSDEKGVKRALTTNLAAAGPRTGRAQRPGKRRRTPVENIDFAAFAVRIIRAHARRIAEGDVDGLAELVALARELDTATQTAVDGLRRFGYSWAEIADRLGTTRQAAHQRWSR